MPAISPAPSSAPYVEATQRSTQRTVGRGHELHFVGALGKRGGAVGGRNAPHAVQVCESEGRKKLVLFRSSTCTEKCSVVGLPQARRQASRNKAHAAAFPASRLRHSLLQVSVTLSPSLSAAAGSAKFWPGREGYTRARHNGQGRVGKLCRARSEGGRRRRQLSGHPGGGGEWRRQRLRARPRLTQLPGQLLLACRQRL